MARAKKKTQEKSAHRRHEEQHSDIVSTAYHIKPGMINSTAALWAVGWLHVARTAVDLAGIRGLDRIHPSLSRRYYCTWYGVRSTYIIDVEYKYQHIFLSNCYPEDLALVHPILQFWQRLASRHEASGVLCGLRVNRAPHPTQAIHRADASQRQQPLQTTTSSRLLRRVSEARQAHSSANQGTQLKRQTAQPKELPADPQLPPKGTHTRVLPAAEAAPPLFVDRAASVSELLPGYSKQLPSG